MSEDELSEVLAGFELEGQLVAVQHQAGGLINTSRRVEISHDGEVRPYLLQSLNTHVFKDIEAVMDNLAAVSAHLSRRYAAAGVEQSERRCLTLVPSRRTDNGLVTVDDVPWRLFHFIEGTVSRTTVENAQQAGAVGHAYGAFQRFLADYPGPQLALTIPHFHDTARRYVALQASVARDSVQRLESCGEELAFAAEQQPLVHVLPELARGGQLPERVVHNDAKPANVLFDEITGEGLAVIDLDTVMPGSALHDFGDMVRSCTSTAGEDRIATTVDVDLDLFSGLVQGYLAEAGSILTSAEREHLALSGVIITYEQGLRFLTDHLDGDVYFSGVRPGHNLARCRNQFALVKALMRQLPELQDIADRA